jgi:hypothetical protein
MVAAKEDAANNKDRRSVFMVESVKRSGRIREGKNGKWKIAQGKWPKAGV